MDVSTNSQLPETVTFDVSHHLRSAGWGIPLSQTTPFTISPSAKRTQRLVWLGFLIVIFLLGGVFGFSNLVSKGYLTSYIIGGAAIVVLSMGLFSPVPAHPKGPVPFLKMLFWLFLKNTFWSRGSNLANLEMYAQAAKDSKDRHLIQRIILSSEQIVLTTPSETHTLSVAEINSCSIERWPVAYGVMRFTTQERAILVLVPRKIFASVKEEIKRRYSFPICLTFGLLLD